MRPTATLATAATLLAASTGFGTAQQSGSTAAPVSHIYLFDSLRITQPALVAGPDAAPGAPMMVVFDVENRSKAADHLLWATVDGAGAVTLKDGAAAAAGDGLLVPASGTLALTAAGPHLEVSGIPAGPGTNPALTGQLRFARAGLLRVSFTPAAAPPPSSEPEGPAVDLAQ